MDPQCGFCLKPVKVCCSFIFESLTQNINMLLISTNIFDSVFTKERNTTNVYYTFISWHILYDVTNLFSNYKIMLYIFKFVILNTVSSDPEIHFLEHKKSGRKQISEVKYLKNYYWSSCRKSWINPVVPSYRYPQLQIDFPRK